MGKLVDTDELYAAFRRDIMGGLNYDRILREAKPVDAVPVVRCKDCARFDKKRGCNLVDGLNIAKTDSFCSYGERKDGDNG